MHPENWLMHQMVLSPHALETATLWRAMMNCSLARTIRQG